MGSNEPVQAPPMQPLGDRVLVKPLEATERMSGGVIIPDTAQEKPQQGIVIAAGPDIKITNSGPWDPREGDDPPRRTQIVVGDRVLYSKYAGSEIVIEDVDYLVIREADCLGILPPLRANAAIARRE